MKTVSSKFSGFDDGYKQTGDRLILLPQRVIINLEEEALALRQAELRSHFDELNKEEQEFAASAIAKSSEQEKKYRLPPLRLHTEYDITDAMYFAENFFGGLKPTNPNLDAELSRDLFIAALMITAYRTTETGLRDVLLYPVDPLWDYAIQIYLALIQAKQIFSQKLAKQWYSKFVQDMKKFDNNEKRLHYLMHAAHKHWTAAFNQPGKGIEIKTSQDAEVSLPMAMVRPCVQIFDEAAMNRAGGLVEGVHSDRQAVGERILNLVRTNNGWRELPDAKQAVINLDATKLAFENLIEPIHRLQNDLVLATAMPLQDFRISPILLLGDPGIGKTFLASQLAKALDVPCMKFSAGGEQGGFQFTGSHASYAGSKPGVVIETLAQSKSASPVFILDEVDKVVHDSRYPIVPVLLDLLDANTAKEFRDEYFEMAFDASRMIVVMTANNLATVPATLVSRAEVFTIPAPDPGQRMRIIESTFDALCKKTKLTITLDAGIAWQLAERMDIDLRQTIRLVSDAFSKALRFEEKLARIDLPKFKTSKFYMAFEIDTENRTLH